MLEILGRVREGGRLAVWGRGGAGFCYFRLRDRRRGFFARMREERVFVLSD